MDHQDHPLPSSFTTLAGSDSSQAKKYIDALQHCSAESSATQLDPCRVDKNSYIRKTNYQERQRRVSSSSSLLLTAWIPLVVILRNFEWHCHVTAFALPSSLNSLTTTSTLSVGTNCFKMTRITPGLLTSSRRALSYTSILHRRNNVASANSRIILKNVNFEISESRLRRASGTSFFFSSMATRTTSALASTTSSSAPILTIQPEKQVHQHDSDVNADHDITESNAILPQPSLLLSPEEKQDCTCLIYESLPEGLCVGVAFQPKHKSSNHPTLGLAQRPWLCKTLHPDELAYGQDNFSHSTAQTAFFLGRWTIRKALSALPRLSGSKSSSKVNNQGKHHANDNGDTNGEKCSILKDEHGRPLVPGGFLGSISHKGTAAVSLVAFDPHWNSNVNGEKLQNPNDGGPCVEDEEDECLVPTLPRMGIGIDLEQCSPTPRHGQGSSGSSKNKSRSWSLARRILTENERNDLGQIEGMPKEEEILLRFSLKESVYKAMHPLLCQSISFQEVEIKPLANGTADVIYNLTNGAHSKLGLNTAHWKRIASVRGDDGGADVESDGMEEKDGGRAGYCGDYFLTSASVCAA